MPTTSPKFSPYIGAASTPGRAPRTPTGYRSLTNSPKSLFHSSRCTPPGSPTTAPLKTHLEKVRSNEMVEVQRRVHSPETATRHQADVFAYHNLCQYTDRFQAVLDRFDIFQSIKKCKWKSQYLDYLTSLDWPKLTVEVRRRFDEFFGVGAIKTISYSSDSDISAKTDSDDDQSCSSSDDSAKVADPDLRQKMDFVLSLSVTVICQLQIQTPSSSLPQKKKRTFPIFKRSSKSDPEHRPLEASSETFEKFMEKYTCLESFLSHYIGISVTNKANLEMDAAMHQAIPLILYNLCMDFRMTPYQGKENNAEVISLSSFKNRPT